MTFRDRMEMKGLIHPWNRDPLEPTPEPEPPKPLYRLQVRHQTLENTNLTATCQASTGPLLELREQLDRLGYEFLKLELVEES